MKFLKWFVLCVVLCGSAFGQDSVDEIAVPMTDDEAYLVLCAELDACNALVDDQDIRDQIDRYTWEIVLLTGDYITTAQSFGLAQERELYWRDRRLLAQTDEEKAEANAAYTAAFNLRFQLAARMSRTLNRISTLFQLIQQLERRLQN